MSTKQIQRLAALKNYRKDPEDWVTGDEPAQIGQLSFLSTLASECGERIPPEVLIEYTKAQASKEIQRYLKIRQEREHRGEETPSNNPPVQVPSPVTSSEEEEWMMKE